MPSFAIPKFTVLLEPLWVSAVFFAFVNRSLIVPYPHESPGRIRYDSVCKTAAKIVNIVKVEHTLPLRDGVCSTNAQIRDGSSYLVIRKSGTTVTPHLYSLE